MKFIYKKNKQKQNICDNFGPRLRLRKWKLSNKFYRLQDEHEVDDKATSKFYRQQVLDMQDMASI